MVNFNIVHVIVNFSSLSIIFVSVTTCVATVGSSTMLPSENNVFSTHWSCSRVPSSSSDILRKQLSGSGSHTELIVLLLFVAPLSTIWSSHYIPNNPFTRLNLSVRLSFLFLTLSFLFLTMSKDRAFRTIANQ